MNDKIIKEIAKELVELQVEIEQYYILSEEMIYKTIKRILEEQY